MSAAPIRWGIVGTGNIAHRFTEDLLRLPDHAVAAVGSRSPATAAAFARRHGLPRHHGSYADLAADDEVDVVYIATPHNVHHSAARTCLEAGRAVLVEKPFTTTAAEADDLIALARARGRFAMEAMWTRFNPVMARLRRLVGDGAIGRVQAVYADFSIDVPYDPRHRVWSAELAGGALLDLGVYPVSFAWMLLGPPDQARAVSVPAPTGVDANTAIVFGYSSGAVAMLHCGLRAESPQTATVIGTTGRIHVAAPFWRPDGLTLMRDGAPPETFGVTLDGHGYTYQAAEVAACLRAGRLESALVPLDETRDILGVLDELRRSPEHAWAPRSADR
ncbi:Gfo/Idh/MocA family protein [Actinomadura litoris]|uniref:Gfo/Idh/MocA family oxidoreductase n=1 Tax=Actinomadura litoris TaxID=2678616 RepID=A0A7K1LAU0_9ACTN|nr:Gfo/Idh/MocA family oxidoreductase [Actinomadura litoris]MUN41534.1 gfo/Idh/MocA family oxidoreductase [Actinomadura litoris]